MALELQLLGPFAAAVDGRPLDSFRSSKTQALLAYLATEDAFDKGGRAQREHLMTLFWPRTPQKSAQVNLRQTLYQLRQAIPDVAGPDGGRVRFILSDRKHVQVNPAAPYELDVARFLLSGALLDAHPSPDEMAEAVALYRGPFLADFHLADSETFEEWAAGRRATLQRMALEALETLTEHHLERAEADEAERYARRQLAWDELRESGHRQLMRALAEQGNRNAALAHYEEYRSLLEAELGVEPSEEIESMYGAIRARKSEMQPAEVRASGLRIKTLGRLSIERDGETVADFASRKAEALLVYLACTRREHPREVLAELLWDERTQRQSMANLRVVLSSLRKAVGPYVSITRAAAAVNAGADVWLDAAELEAAAVATEEGEAHSSPAAMEALRGALSLYEGDFLAGYSLPEASGFEAWIVRERERLHRLALDGLRRVGRWHLGQEDYAAAIVTATRQVQLDPLTEAGHRQLMEALARNGQRAKALAQYETCRETLEEELGVEPGPETEALYEAIREGQVASATAPSALARMEVIKTRHRLPSPATPFVGRQRELKEITEQLADGCQLVTLLGTGGCGKTRLGIEVARQLAGRYRNGAAFVELAPLSEAAAIPTAIATAVDFRFSGGGSPREQVLNYLANKELLLVLDNVEHVLEGAGLVDDLLGVAPDVRLLATSRARLNLGAECLFEVGGLATAETGSEAVEMFIEYARRVQPGFDLDEKVKQAITRICQLVEGMPLAIELAASWLRVLPAQEIARELAEDVDFLDSERADLPERQRSMRAAFDYSWNMLDESEQAALMKLSVFRGGASRRAARAVTGASLRALLTLADHSLLTMDPDSGRFAVHEMIRQFAMERLDEAGDAEAVQDAHSAYYLQALGQRLPDLKGRDQLGPLDAIEDDFENVRGAWHWAIRQGQWEDFPEASQSLFLFALFRERQLDGIELFETAHKALPSPTIPAEQLARAYALAGGHWLLSWIGSHEEALAAVPDLETAVGAMAEPAAIAYCQMMLGQVLLHRTASGEYPAEAIAALEEARAYYQKARDPFYSALVLWRLGYAQARARQLEEGFDLTRRGLRFAREVGDRFLAGALLSNLGATLSDLGTQREAADRYYREAAELEWEIGARGSYALTLANLAENLLWRDADLEKSSPLLEEAHAIAAEQNKLLFRTHALGLLTDHRILEGRYEEALALAAELLAFAKENTGAWTRAHFLRGLAYLAVGEMRDALYSMNRGLSLWKDDARTSSRPDGLFYCLAYCTVPLARHGEHERAAELLALGLTNPKFRGGLEIDPLLARTRAELEEALGEERFAAAWARGKALDAQVVMPEVIAALEEMEAAAGDGTKA